MNLDQFWNIIEKVHHDSAGDMPTKCKLLAEYLRTSSPDEIRSFREHFTECLDRAYTYEMWAAAYIIGGGCSDDKFWDFRSTLISMGRVTYESAMADPQSFADMDYDAENCRYEGFQYVPGQVYEAVTGSELSRHKPHPRSPTGYDWDESELAELYPKLVAKYEFR